MTLSRHGPGLGQGGKDPAHGPAEGLHQRFHAAEAGRKGPSTSRMSAASQSPITVTMPWLSQGLSGHRCGLLQADSKRQQHAFL